MPMHEFSDYPEILKIAMDALAEAGIVGAMMTLSERESRGMTDRQERDVVHSNLAGALTYEIMKATVIDRSVTRSPSDLQPFAVKFSAEVALMPRAAYQTLQNAVAAMMRESIDGPRPSEAIADFRDLLERLDRHGGLGLEIHGQIRSVLAKHKGKR